MPLPRLNRLTKPPSAQGSFQVSLIFPKGLFGFENLTRFMLIGCECERPYFRLESKELASLSFMVIDPFQIHPHYEPLITKKDICDVGVTGGSKLSCFAILDITEEPITANLEAPLLIHWRTKLGKQLLFRL